MDIDDLQVRLRVFAEERDWDRFHSPKNLSMALSVEVAELVEHFQWMSEDESRSLEPSALTKVAEEVADIQIYLARFADKLGIDIAVAVDEKIEANRKKYPPELVRGKALKYTEYQGGTKK
jgi:NTP pyrophosphatase (non-canonical NTP hydrolase)